MKNDTNRVLGRVLAVDEIARVSGGATTALGDTRPDFDSSVISDSRPISDSGTRADSGTATDRPVSPV